jgi:hypothetical protein
MNNVFLYSVVNFQLTLIYRMIQGTSPIKIRLDRIKRYDPPFGMSLRYFKIVFGMLIIYIGIPLVFIQNKITVASYLLYWFLTIWWWRYFSLCSFKKCVYMSSVSTCICLIGLSVSFHQNKLFVYFSMPYLWWSVYTLYISIWYDRSYVNTSFILS